jgi:hypothetical protein
MSLRTDELPAAVNWRKLHAFGLPAGSVRAILALLVFTTIWALVLLKPDRAVPDYMRDLLFIILGHYFAVRRRAPAADEPGPPPLYLPKGTIRLVSVLGFILVAALLYRQGRLMPIERRPGAVTLILVGGFLLGVILAQVSAWLKDRGLQPPRYVEDLRALLAVIAAVVLVVLVWDHFLPELHPPRAALGRLPRVALGEYGLENVLAAVVGFYFGSRS